MQKNEQHEDEQKMEQDEVEAVEVFDFDKEVERDMSAVSQYAMDIFNYYKYREVGFVLLFDGLKFRKLFIFVFS